MRFALVFSELELLEHRALIMATPDVRRGKRLWTEVQAFLYFRTLDVDQIQKEIVASETVGRQIALCNAIPPAAH